MDYQEFLDQVCQQVRDYLPPSFQTAEISINKVVKNNDLTLDGLVIHREGDTVVPQIYLNRYFELYENGVGVPEILMDICAKYFHYAAPQFQDMPENILDYEQVKNRITIQLVNKHTNSNLLKELPCMDIDNTDLTAIFKIALDSSEYDSAMIRVTNDLMKRWGAELESVYQNALSNTQREYPAQIQKMSLIVAGIMFGGETPWENVKDCEMEAYEQYVLTNQARTYGAGVLLYPEVLQQIADNTGSNFFILPSSIHEIILLKDTGEMSAEELQAIVIGTNAEAVPNEEQLSDEVYYYDGKAHAFSMVTSKEQTAQVIRQFHHAMGFSESEQEMESEQEI